MTTRFMTTKPMARWLAALLLMTTAALVIPATARAQSAGAAETYPARPVRVVIPFAPGGALDTVARLVAQKLGEKLGQPFVVENKPGAANMIGNDLVAKATPDGHTLLFAAAPIALNQALGIKTPYDAQRDFAPISLVASGGVLVLVHPSAPWRTMQDIVQAAKASPAGLNYATAGVGSMPHLIGEGWKVQSGANLTHIGYKGSAQAMQDAVAGTITLLLDGYTPSGVMVENGKLRAIAYAGKNRLDRLPNVPTTAEQGFPELVGGGFFGLLAPAGTARPIIDKLYQSVREVLAQPDVRDRLTRQGYEIHGSTPAEYTAFIRREIERWTPVVKAAGIKPD